MKRLIQYVPRQCHLVSELRHVHADAFSDDEFHRGVQFIDSTTTSEPEKYLCGHFDDFREYAGDANRLIHAGGLRVRYPWRASTGTAQGPTTVSYSVSHALTKTETETKGWSAGGLLKLSIGKLGDATFSGSYTYSRTNSTAWTNTVNSTLKLDITDRRSPDTGSELRRFTDYMSVTLGKGSPASLVGVVLMPTAVLARGTHAAGSRPPHATHAVAVRPAPAHQRKCPLAR